MISQVASWLKSYYPDDGDRLIEFPVSRRQALVIGAVVVSAVGLVSYAVHVDRKRRADPNYKQTIRERRHLSASEFPASGGSSGASGVALQVARRSRLRRRQARRGPATSSL